jgi:type I restriction enzyme S subunit
MEAEHFVEEPLGDLVEILDSQRKPVKSADRKSGPYPYYGASGVTDYVDSYIFEGVHLLLSEDGDNLRSRNTPIAFLADGKFWVNNHAHVLKGNRRNDTKFLCYALQIADITSYLSGSTRPKLNQKDMKRIPVFSPPLAEQQAIAGILGALDDKIELNRRMNGTLEGMARAVFKSWFVDFDPVRAKLEGRPPPGLDPATAALFPDSFEEQDGQRIPKGWRIYRIADLTDRVTKGTTPKKSELANADPDDQMVNFVRVNCMGDDGSLNHSQFQSIPESIHLGSLKRSVLKKGDVLYSIAGTIGRVAVVDDSLLPANTNQAVAILRPSQPLPSGFLALVLSSKPFQEELHYNIVQAVQANLSLGMISDAKVICPPMDDLLKLYPILGSLIDQIGINRTMSQTLANLRDTLLPKLLSGEIRVPVAEKAVEAVL